jgi:hypothetical protein
MQFLKHAAANLLDRLLILLWTGAWLAVDDEPRPDPLDDLPQYQTDPTDWSNQ